MATAPHSFWTNALRTHFSGDREFDTYAHQTSLAEADHKTDYLLIDPDQPCSAKQIFDRLRWGGQALWIDPDPIGIEEVLRDLEEYEEFVVERNLEAVETEQGQAWCFALRKVRLDWGDDHDYRFTFEVELVWDEDARQYHVRKSVPEEDLLLQRIQQLHPELDEAKLKQRAEWLGQSFLPIILRREARTMKALREALPETWQGRVPQVFHVEKLEGGRAESVTMQWLRNGPSGKPRGHLAFVRQIADLLSHIHAAGFLHLDLRPDNTVLMPEGVGFVDFGSAYRTNEQKANSEAVTKIYRQVAQGSEVQKKLGQLIEQKLVTNPVLCKAHGQMHEGVDLFSLALQLNHPLVNPAFEGLVDYDPDSPETKALCELSDRILKPDPHLAPPIGSVAEVCVRLDQIAHQVAHDHAPAS
ncbi:MAG: hypothetical protein R3236_00970 [Phycisphaeraceae bacterium]|nr:hypothetical protein [Phycisphaeraceae bacterium]